MLHQLPQTDKWEPLSQEMLDTPAEEVQIHKDTADNNSVEVEKAQEGLLVISDLNFKILI